MEDKKISIEMLKKIKETFDISIKCSNFLMTAMLFTGQDCGIEVKDVLYMQKNYYEINEFIEKSLKEE